MKKISPWIQTALLTFAAICLFGVLVGTNSHVDVEETLLQYGPAILIASLLILVGHGFRIQRTRTLLRAAGVESGFKGQVAPLAVGLMLNALVPFKLGEFVRAILISRSLNISKLYALAVVVVERLMDIALTGWAFSFALMILGEESLLRWLPVSLSAGLAATLSLLALTLAVKENRYIFALISRISSLFNKSLEYRIQHSTYSVIHGYQVFLKSETETIRYLGNFVVSWVFYIAASFTLVSWVLGKAPNFFELLSPFVAGNNLVSSPGAAEYSASIADLLKTPGATNLEDLKLAAFGVALWISLQGLVILFGLLAMPILAGSSNQQLRKISEKSVKIDRASPPARNLSSFIELYFERQDLARNFHAEDVRGESEVIGFFKGGSDAITALIRKSDQLRVRKTIDLGKREKLRNQYLWLRNHQSNPRIVSAIEERTTPSLYSIDLEYSPNAVPFFDYIHSQPLSVSESLLDDVLDLISDNVWQIDLESDGLAALDSYLNSRLFRRLEGALSSSQVLREIYGAKTVEINGVPFENLGTLLDEILGTAAGRARLAKHRVNLSMHGDLTVDNLLVDMVTKTPIVIDPSDDNEFRSTVLDYARMHQSLAGGYEFCNQYEGKPEVKVNFETSKAEIRFFDYKTRAYDSLDARLLVHAKASLTASEFESLNFFTGVFFARMLDHRVKINAGTAPIYYAKAVQFLSEYLKEAQ